MMMLTRRVMMSMTFKTFMVTEKQILSALVLVSMMMMQMNSFKKENFLSGPNRLFHGLCNSG